MKFRLKSLRQRFTLGLAGIITLTFFIFSIVLIAYNSSSLEKDLKTRLENLTKLAGSSLSSALWQYNYEYINDYLDAIFSYEDLTFAGVTADGRMVKERWHQNFQGKSFPDFSKSPKFITQESDVVYQEVVVGKVFLVLSRERIDNLILKNSAAAIALLILINLAIFITNYIFTRKYLFQPLDNLKNSARSITQGRLNTPIDTSSEDEIGQLARTFDQMIKRLKTTTASRDELEDEIKDRLRIEAELKRSQALLEATGKTARVGGWEYDPRSKALFWSREIYNIYEITPERIPQLDESLHYFHKDDQGKINQAIHQALENGEPYDMELRFVTAGGKKLWTHNIGIPETADGKTVRLIGTFQDITKRVLAENENKSLENQLRQSQKMEAIGTLAGGIAHDFNNMLAIIIGNTEMALEDIPEWNPAKEYLKEVQNASLRAKDVVRHILSFSRKAPTERKPIKMGPIVADSLKMLRASIPADIQIRPNLSCEADMIKADPTQMGQMLMNLCTNAAHAMRDAGGILEVSLENVALEKRDAVLNLEPGFYVKLAVCDTGHGIKSKHIDRIYDPYFTTKDLGEGTGLGLSVVQGIVKAHNGTITVKSELGQGTVFEVLFPVIEDNPASESERPTGFPTGNEKILLVDDEPSILKLTQKRLEMQGYQVAAINDPVEALELFRSQPDRFDLVITDMTMPYMTGDKLTRAILSVCPEMPVILCSGYSDRIDDHKSAMLGVRKYIEKPLNMSDFMLSIRNVLDEANG